MSEGLPRRKPDPVPTIHPVAEYAASGRLAEVYDRTKRALGVPWMGVVAMAFAHYPTFYDRLWSALEPMVAGPAFAAACADLRRTAEEEAGKLGPPPIRDRLIAMGYGEGELEDIVACNEVFSAGNMPYVLMATLARAMLEGIEWTGQGASTPLPASVPEMPRPPLMEVHHADPETRALYADLRKTLGLPFVNTDYRAFARWPSYFATAWGDLKPVALDACYQPAVTRVHHRAVSLALSLPNVTGMTPQALIDAAAKDADPDQVRDVVRLFQWLLPGLALNVGFLRAQLVR
ncbi:hypothetical protein ACFORG_03115 [Lutimaribacter marinistellae]|uniref:(R)-2-haloacid dehalogenase n=1 Tax=Lutimaribacter marinistellae TaxID=1820329 RepID=A0ABV7TD00_9RHOB